MVVKKVYDENLKEQKVWYDSTMFCFTRAVEHDSDNLVDLYVTFKNGWEYVYKNVKLEDYVLLLSGFEETSHGKTLNRIIKPKYEFEKLGKKDVNEIWEEYHTLTHEEKVKEEDISKTYFVSGHRDITLEEFEFNYQEALNDIVSEVPDCKFVVGDCEGVDIMAQNYLIDVLSISPDRITVYHISDSPRNINEKIKNTKGGFTTDSEKDAAMTAVSIQDIAFVRDCAKISGTGENILRRYLLK